MMNWPHFESAYDYLLTSSEVMGRATHRKQMAAKATEPAHSPPLPSTSTAAAKASPSIPAPISKKKKKQKTLPGVVVRKASVGEKEKEGVKRKASDDKKDDAEGSAKKAKVDS